MFLRTGASLSLDQYYQNIAFKAVEALHQTQWQLSCHQIWRKVKLFYSDIYKFRLNLIVVYALRTITNTCTFNSIVLQECDTYTDQSAQATQ